MTWRFDVVATAQERLLSRILQILEVQRVSIHSFVGVMDGMAARVTFVVSSKEDNVYRIEALLHRLEGVDRVLASTELDDERKCARRAIETKESDA
jgi:hypothetical protein